MGYLLMAHSLVRWLIALAALAAVIRLIVGLVQKSAYDRMANGLLMGYSGLLDLQVLLGITFLLWNGLTSAGFPLYRIEHAATMIVAVAVAHLPRFWKKSPDTTRYRNGLLAVVGSAVLIFFGVLLLPQGWLG